MRFLRATLLLLILLGVAAAIARGIFLADLGSRLGRCAKIWTGWLVTVAGAEAWIRHTRPPARALAVAEAA